MKRGKNKEPWAAADPSHGCIVCGSPYIHIHHVFYGTANRKLSEQYGYKIPLCQMHHTGPEGIHFKRELDLFWKKAAQVDFESKFGTRDDFRKTFGRSYL